MDKTGLFVYDNIKMTEINIQGRKYNILGLQKCTNCFQISINGIEKKVGKGEKNYFEVFTVAFWGQTFFGMLGFAYLFFFAAGRWLKSKKGHAKSIPTKSWPFLVCQSFYIHITLFYLQWMEPLSQAQQPLSLRVVLMGQLICILVIMETLILNTYLLFLCLLLRSQCTIIHRCPQFIWKTLHGIHCK